MEHTKIIFPNRGVSYRERTTVFHDEEAAGYYVDDGQQEDDSVEITESQDDVVADQIVTRDETAEKLQKLLDMVDHYHMMDYKSQDEFCICLSLLKFSLTKLVKLLGLDRKTIYFCRKSGKLRNEVDDTGHVFFTFRDVYEAVAYQGMIRNEEKEKKAIIALLNYIDLAIIDYHSWVSRKFRRQNFAVPKRS